MRTIALTLMLAACGGKSTTTTTTTATTSTIPQTNAPPPSGPTCESAIGNSMTLTIAAATDAEREQMRTQLDAAKPKMITACHEDAWSVQLLACLDKARTDADTGTCTELLTPAQQAGVQKRLSAP